MAGPPFNIDASTPASTDLVSAFPANEQANRQIIEDWLTFLSDPTTGLIKQAALPASAQAQAGYISGLTLSNNTGAPTTSLDIAVGVATSSNGTTAFNMKLASGLTKSLAAVWAVGTGTGGLDTGTVANNTYHVWLIARSDTGVVDVAFSLSASAPTIGTNIPAAYDRYRRIGSIIRLGGTIRSFIQTGDTFILGTAILNYTTTTNLSSTLLAFSSPVGIVTAPLIQFNCTVATGGVMAQFLGSAVAGGVTTQVQLIGTNAGDVTIPPPVFFTDTSANLWLQIVAAAPITGNSISTVGWIDTRGKG